MRRKVLATIGSALIALPTLPARAEVSEETLESLSTPDRLETSIGTLEFNDGAPSADTAQTVYDTLDFTRALNVYNNSFRGASAYAIRKAFQSIGADDNDVVIFSELMDANSLFLTANADTVYYYLSVLDLTKGPMALEQPSGGLGTSNDMWFSWVIDIGRPGPDRGLGGKYLIVPPGYDGPLPEGGYFVAHSKTDHVLYAARSFLVDNDPKPAVENIKASMKNYPYVPGSYGTSIAEALEGKVKPAPEPKVPETKFIEASGVSFNTIPPSDYGFFEMINENVQNEPATSYDVELAGQLAAIGIFKGKEFAPDERLKKILTDAAAVGNAFGRALNWHFAQAHPDWAYYPDSHWGNMLFEGGAFFEIPPPLFEDGMFKRFPPTGARTLDSRTAFYYAYTLDSPAMIMRIPDVGSQYLMGFLDADGEPFDGAMTYKVTLPKDIPARAFWFDNQTRSMLQTPQKYPRAGSQSYPSPAAEAAEDGSTIVWFAPEQPQGGPARQPDPDHARQGLVHHPAPLQPAAVVLRQDLAHERDRAGAIDSQMSAPKGGNVESSQTLPLEWPVRRGGRSRP